MVEIVIMPKLGFDMAEGTLVRWVVAEGSPVEKGAVLAEIETDKATVEVESSFSGIVRRHIVDEGSIVPVNTPIAVIGGSDEVIDLSMLLDESAPKMESELKTVTQVEEAEAAQKEMVVTIETKTAIPQSREEPRIPTLDISASEEGALPGGVRASPIARRLAEEQGIDLRKVKGSGPRGRIVRADIESYREAPLIPPGRILTPITVSFGESRQDQRIPLSRLRGAIGRRMVQAKQQIPHFYITHDYDIGAVMEMRAKVNAILPEEEKLSVNDFIVKAVALTLREFPNLNAALDEKNKEVIQFGRINIGVAVAVENGLLTVVCQDADMKPIRQISSEVRSTAARAREGKVRPEDIEGSTFSISNLGMFAVDEFIAIINPPEAAILAIGSVLDVPVVKNGEIKPGLRMKATISVDHRISDGAEAARFLVALTRYLEEPMRLVI